MSDFISSFRDAIKNAGITYTGEIEPDGKLHRFSPDGSNGKPSWYVLHVHERFAAGNFGCFRSGINQNWKSTNGGNLTKEEKEQLSRDIAAAQLVKRTEEEQIQFECKKEAQRILSESVPDITAHPYLEKKHVLPFGEIRCSKDGCLLLPVRSIDGILLTLQLIAPDKRFGENGHLRDKTYLFGGKVQGAFYEVANSDNGPLVICEGYATGASIHQATNLSVVCALAANNLSPVAVAFRKKYPSRLILIAADNDRFTSIDGRPHNTGLVEAQKAVAAAKAKLVVPEFSDLDTTSTDFNDLFAQSEDAVRTAFETVLNASNDWSLLLQDGCKTLTESIPDPVQLVENLLTEQSKLVIASSSKSYKTWFSIFMAVCLSTGRKFLNNVCVKIPILYINLELKEKTFKKRLQIICEKADIALDPLYFHHVSLRGKLTGLSVHEIINRFIALARINSSKTVFLDPVYKVNLEGDENSSKDQTKLFNELDRVTTEANSALVINDHFSKGNQSEKDPLDAIRGSSAKGGDVDAAMVIRTHTTKGSFTIDVVHRELPPVEPFVVTWNFPFFELNESLDPADLKKPKSTKQKFYSDIQLLEPISNSSQDKPVSLSEWSRLSEIPRTSIIGYTTSLRTRGLISTIGEGNAARQFITQKGIEACRT